MDENDMAEEWSAALRRAGRGLQPRPDAADQIAREVRRRRHRRRAAALAGITGAAVLALVVTLVATRTDERRPDLVATDPAADPDLFSCATENPVFTSTVDPPADQVRAWEDVLAEIEGTTFTGFAVKHVEVTGVGVVALVTGDEQAARQLLTQEYGAAAVHAWDPSGPSVGLDVDGQVSQVVQWTLDPVLHAARRATRGIEGSAGLAYWNSSGAILVQWKEPVPAEIRALEARTFPRGGRILVQGVTYSDVETEAAMHRVLGALKSGEVDGDFSMAMACGDGTGIIIGVTPESLGDRRAALQEDLAPIAQMPAMVVPAEQAVPLVGKPGG